MDDPQAKALDEAGKGVASALVSDDRAKGSVLA